MYELLFSSQQPKTKGFRRYCCNVMFPQIRQQLTNKMKEEHQQAITDQDNQIQVFKYENVAFQAQRDVQQTQLQKCQDTIIHLKTRYVDHARDPSKDNIIIIVWKRTGPANDKFHDLPYYVAMIQQPKRYVKLRWFDQYFPDHKVIVETDNPNSIHGFNRFEEKGQVGRRYNHFRLIDLTREELHVMGVPPILDEE